MLTLSELQEITGKEVLLLVKALLLIRLPFIGQSNVGWRIGVLDGRDIRRIEDALEGRSFEGTLVQPE